MMSHVQYISTVYGLPDIGHNQGGRHRSESGVLLKAERSALDGLRCVTGSSGSHPTCMP